MNLVNQMVSFEDDRGVNPVFVDGRMVIEDGRITTLDEEHLVAGYQATGEAVVARSGFPDQVGSPTTWCLTVGLSADRPAGRR